MIKNTLEITRSKSLQYLEPKRASTLELLYKYTQRLTIFAI